MPAIARPKQPRKNEKMEMIWYESLNKPFLTPPSWVFAPAWIFLYILILASFFTYVYSNSEKNKFRGYLFFTLQLLLNFAWSPVFFHLHDIRLSFAIICLLLIFLILTIIAFYKISKIAAALLVPYFVWVCFAIYLNYGVLSLN